MSKTTRRARPGSAVSKLRARVVERWEAVPHRLPITEVIGLRTAIDPETIEGMLWEKRAHRDVFLYSPAFEKVMQAAGRGDRAVNALLVLLDFLEWAHGHRRLIDTTDPHEVLDTTQYNDKVQKTLRVMSYLSELRPDMRLHPSGYHTEHRWASRIDPGLLAKSGGGKKDTKERNHGLWRGVLRRSLEALIPVRTPDRPSVIAELLRLTGDTTITHHHVITKRGR